MLLTGGNEERTLDVIARVRTLPDLNRFNIQTKPNKTDTTFSDLKVVNR